MNPITVTGSAIRQDSKGRFCLNDLHQAAIAGGVTKDIRPNEWLSLAQTQELIEILIAENPAFNPRSIKAGRYGGTFVCKELVYAYAMWVSPQFHLHVIRTFDQAVREAEERRHVREATKDSIRLIGFALETTRAEAGKATEHFHFSNEARMINTIMEELFGHGDRGSMDKGQLRALDKLQRMNCHLISKGLSLQDRKGELHAYGIGLLGSLIPSGQATAII